MKKVEKLHFKELRYDKTTYKGIVSEVITGITTNDAGNKTPQWINVFRKDKDIEVVNWSTFINGEYRKSDTLTIAKDFQNLHKEYEVIAGINGDYFNYDGETINCNVIYGNRSVKPDNHIKYQAMEFDKFGNKVNIHKTTSVNNQLTLTILNDKNNNKYIVTYNDLSSDVSILTNDLHEDVDEEKYNIFPLEIIRNHKSNKYRFIEAIITNKKNEFFLISNNKRLNESLKIKNIIKIQNEVCLENEENMIMGYDAIIVDNGMIKTFDNIGGQSHEHNVTRNPKSGFGYDNDENLILITADGNPDNLDGLDMREFAVIMRHCGIVNGYGLDGGGSTQAVFKVNNELKVINTPDEYPLRPVGNALLFVKKLK